MIASPALSCRPLAELLRPLDGPAPPHRPPLPTDPAPDGIVPACAFSEQELAVLCARAAARARELTLCEDWARAAAEADRQAAETSRLVQGLQDATSASLDGIRDQAAALVAALGRRLCAATVAERPAELLAPVLEELLGEAGLTRLDVAVGRSAEPRVREMLLPIAAARGAELVVRSLPEPPGAPAPIRIEWQSSWAELDLDAWIERLVAALQRPRGDIGWQQAGEQA